MLSIFFFVLAITGFYVIMSLKAAVYLELFSVKEVEHFNKHFVLKYGSQYVMRYETHVIYIRLHI